MPLLVVIGYGPGNGHAIAHRFGREGWSIALIGRRAERLNAGVAHLGAAGVTVRGFVGDAGDPASLRATLQSIRAELGPVSAIALTAYRNVVVDDVLTAPPATVAHVFDIGVAGLLTGALGAGNRYPLKLAAAVLMTIPVAVMFFVFQKRIISGALEGGVKE